LFFHISCLSALGFVCQKPLLVGVLIICSLSVKISAVFKQDIVVVGLRCWLSPVGWGVWHSSQAFTHCTRPSPQHCSDWGKLAGVSYKRISCQLLGYFYYRSFHSLCTGSQC
jgi:hypothetical protein